LICAAKNGKINKGLFYCTDVSGDFLVFVFMFVETFSKLALGFVLRSICLIHGHSVLVSVAEAMTENKMTKMMNFIDPPFEDLPTINMPFVN
jgi:hypothetical protein